MFKKIFYVLCIIPLLISCKKDDPGLQIDTSDPVYPGQYLLFDADEAFNTGLTTYPSPYTSIYYTNLDGSGLTRVTPAENGYYSYRPSWAPDGKSVLFIRGNQGDDYRSICSINIDGTNFKSLVQGNKVDYPSYSPDGKKLIYAKTLGTTPPYPYDIYVSNADGTGEQRITNFADDNGAVSNMHCSSDGKIYFYGGSQHVSSGVYSVNLDGSGLKFNLNDVDFLDISPDGKYILFDLANGLFICNNDGTNIRTLLPFDNSYPDNLVGASWSPDGYEIYFSNANYPTNYGLYRINTQGYGLQQLRVGYYEFPQVF